MSSDARYGDLIRIDRDGGSPEVLQRKPLTSGVTEGSLAEAMLQELLFKNPECLPIPAIDPAYADAVPVCMELRTPSGYVDALYVNRFGRLTLCEFKLWRNPQARREVIGQILDYAKDLASWGYEDLQRQVSLALGGEGSNVLYELVSEQHAGIVEAEFVDNVTRHLRRGEFLLLIVGDGIQERAEKIVDFIGRHSGLHFNLALVEAALYADGANQLIVQPRVLARTEILRRFVVDHGVVEEGMSPGIDDEQEPLSDQEEENLRFWKAVLRDYSFADKTVEPPLPRRLPTIHVLVGNSGFGGWALFFTGYIHRSGGTVGCFVVCRKGHPREQRIFDETLASLEEWGQRMGVGLDKWIQGDRPRFGFRRKGLSFLSGSEDSEDYQEAVSWMREHLNRLVSGLHSHFQERLRED